MDTLYDSQGKVVIENNMTQDDALCHFFNLVVDYIIDRLDIMKIYKLK